MCIVCNSKQVAWVVVLRGPALIGPTLASVLYRSERHGYPTLSEKLTKPRGLNWQTVIRLVSHTFQNSQTFLISSENWSWAVLISLFKTRTITGPLPNSSYSCNYGLHCEIDGLRLGILQNLEIYLSFKVSAGSPIWLFFCYGGWLEERGRKSQILILVTQPGPNTASQQS